MRLNFAVGLVACNLASVIHNLAGQGTDASIEPYAGGIMLLIVGKGKITPSAKLEQRVEQLPGQSCSYHFL